MKWWRIPAAMLLATIALSIGFVPPASAQAVPDGTCDVSSPGAAAATCADEALFLGLTVAQYLAGAGMSYERCLADLEHLMGEEVLCAGFPLEDDGGFLEDVLDLVGMTEDELRALCFLFPNWWPCAGLPEPDPGDDYGLALGGLNTTFYDAEYGVGETGPNTAHYGHAMPEGSIDLSGAGTTINFWLDSAITGVAYALLTGGDGSSWWSIVKQGGANGIGLDTGVGPNGSTSHDFPATYTTEFGTDEYMVTLTQEGSDWDVYINGEHAGSYNVAPPGNLTPAYYSGWDAGMWSCCSADAFRWDQSLWHLSVHEGLLTPAQIEGLVAWGSEPGFFGADYEVTPTEPFPSSFPTPDPSPVPGDAPEEVPAPDPASPPTVPEPEVVTEGEGDQGLFDQLANRFAGMIDLLANSIGSFFSWLGTHLTALFSYLVGELWGAIEWLWENLQLFLEWIGGLLGDILDAIIAMTKELGKLLQVIGQAIGELADSMIGLLSVVWLAIVGLPAAIWDLFEAGLEALFVPESIDIGALATECETAFPCSWIQEIVDAAAEFGGVVDGTGSCTAPSFDTGMGGELSLPAPDGCAGGNGASDGDAGDLFGYRTMLRAVLLVSLIAGAMFSVLRMTPWGFEEPIRPDL